MIYALGDINIDVPVYASSPGTEHPACLPGLRTGDPVPGGVAVNFFNAATEICEEVRIIGQVEDDFFGKFVQHAYPIAEGHRITTHPVLPTGIMYIMESGELFAQSNRRFATNRPNANHMWNSLEFEDVIYRIKKMIFYLLPVITYSEKTPTKL